MADAKARFLITADDKASATLRKVRGNLKDTAISAKRLALSLGAVLGGVGFVAATKGALNFADSIADASEKTAFTVEKLQELKFAAEQNGVSFRELESGLARFTKRLGLARIGAGAANKTYQDLGINLKRSNSEVFQQVVATLGAMEDETDRLALATRLFGDDAQRLGVVFKDGNQGLKEYADRAHELGLILSDDLVQGASDANDQLDIMQKVLQTQLTSALVELAPIITSIGQAFAEAAPHVTAFFQSFGDAEGMGFAAARDSLASTYDRLEEIQKRLARAREIESATQPGGSGTRVSSQERMGLLLGNYDVDELEKEEKRLLDLAQELQDRLTDIQIAGSEARAKIPTVASPGNISGLGGGGSTGRAGGSGRSSVDIEAQREATRLLREQEEQWRRMQAVIDEVDPVAPLRRQLVALEELQVAFPQYTDVIQEQMLNVHEEMDSFNGVLEDQKKITEEVADQWQELGPVFSSAFEDAIVEGKSFSDVLKGLEKDILRIATRKLVTEPLGNSIAGLFSGGGGGIGNLFGSFLGGARAEGGPIRAGMPYLVGEEGPELIVPRAPGNVMTAQQTATRGNTTIVLNGVQDFDSFRRNETQLRRAAHRAVRI